MTSQLRMSLIIKKIKIRLPYRKDRYSKFVPKVLNNETYVDTDKRLNV